MTLDNRPWRRPRVSDEPDGSAVNPCAFRPLCLRHADEIRHLRAENSRRRKRSESGSVEIMRLRAENARLRIEADLNAGRCPVCHLGKDGVPTNEVYLCGRKDCPARAAIGKLP